MKSLIFAGAIAIAFALGGVTTLLGVTRSSPTIASTTVSVSPEDITRSAGPLPEIVVESYM
jgi:hypothetical protein